MLKRLINSLRYWAIQSLAGRHTIIINAKFTPSGRLYVNGNGCYMVNSWKVREEDAEDEQAQ